jgi:hypothetical protein
MDKANINDILDSYYLEAVQFLRSTKTPLSPIEYADPVASLILEGILDVTSLISFIQETLEFTHIGDELPILSNFLTDKPKLSVPVNHFLIYLRDNGHITLEGDLRYTATISLL